MVVGFEKQRPQQQQQKTNRQCASRFPPLRELLCGRSFLSPSIAYQLDRTKKPFWISIIFTQEKQFTLSLQIAGWLIDSASTASFRCDCSNLISLWYPRTICKRF
jgi:hypothetical protein